MRINDYFQENILLHQKIVDEKKYLEGIEETIAILDECLQSGNKILIAGNGGSAADAQHFAGEVVGRYKKERKGYPAISLSTDTSVMTAWANDYDFDTIFSRQIEALGKKGDVFFGLSTSGNSKNIIEAVNMAKELGMKSICLLGKDGGKLKNMADIALVVPSDNTPRVQEIHILTIHSICEEIEKNFQ